MNARLVLRSLGPLHWASNPLRRFIDSRRIAFALAGSIASLLGASTARADNGIWTNINTDGTWVTAGNWNGGIIPGIAGGTNSTDVATFSSSPNLTARTVTIDANRNIGRIVFNNSSSLGYIIAGGSTVPLRLSSDGAIQAESTNGPHTDAVTAPVIIQGDGGRATFTANASSPDSILSIGAVSGITISGVSTAGNTTTLTLNGSNGNVGNTAGILSNGTAGGKLALVKEGTGIWTIGFASNVGTFTGGVTISEGTLRTAASTAGQALGAANLVSLANTAGATLDISSLSQTIGSLAGGGTTGGNVTLGSSTLTTGIDDNDASYAGVISGTGGLIKSGTGTQTLTGTNAYGGGTRVNGGTLKLDFSSGTAPASNIISSSSALTLSGGTLALTGKESTPNAQTFASTTLALGGSSALALTAHAMANPLLLTIGTITRNPGATLDLTLPAGTQGTTNGIRTGSVNLSNGVFVIGGVAFATVDGTTWAGRTGTGIQNLVPFTSAGGSYSAGNINYVSNRNVDVFEGDAPDANFTVNTLRFNGDYALTLTGNSNVVSTGGILVTSAATTGATMSGGTIRSADTTNALQFINYGSQLTVNSNIADNGATATIVTFAGPGTTLLNGTNTYTGATYITGGRVKLGSAAALGSAAIVTVADKAGAVLDLNGFDLSIASLAGGGAQGTSGQASIGTDGGTVALGDRTLTVGDATSPTFGGAITGTGGSLVKVGAGMLTLNGANTFTGGVTIKAGTLTASGVINNNALGPGALTLGDSTGNAPATLRVGGGLSVLGVYTYNNPIVLGTTTGLLDVTSVSSSGGATLTGGVTGPNHFRINATNSGGGTLTFSTNPINNSGTLTIGGSTVNTNIVIGGGIGSNVTDVFISKINAGSTNGTTINTNPVNNSGTITINGTNTAPTAISSFIGINVTGITQSSGNATTPFSVLTLSGTNAFRGPITITAGTVSLGATLASGISSAVTLANVASASLNITVTTQNLGSLAGGGTTGGNVNLNSTSASTLTVGSDHTSTTYGGSIGGANLATIGLRKIGTGTLTLTRASAYTGTTNVTNGSLAFDYASTDPLASNALTLNGGRLVFKGNAGGTTTDSVGTVTLTGNSRNGIAVQGNAVITTGAWSSTGSSNPLLVDITSGTLKTAAFGTSDIAGASVIKLNDILMMGSTTTGTKRANLYVKDATGIGFATQNGDEIARYTGATELFPGVNEGTGGASNTANFKLSASLTRTAAITFQTFEINTAGGAVTLNMGANNFSGNGSGRGVLVTGSNDATITGTGIVTGSNLLNLANYGTGTTTLDMNLVMNALVKNGPGLVVYSGSTMTADTQVTEGTLRFATAIDYSGNQVRIHGGGIFELGADLNGAVAGDFTKPLGNSANVNGVALIGDGGFSAHGGDRIVNLGGAAVGLTWGSGAFFSDPGSTSTDNDYIFNLGSATSTSTLDFVNPINLGARQRYVETADGTDPANVDAKLSGVLSATVAAVPTTGGLTKTGAGTLELSASNTFTGPTIVTGGTLKVSGSINASGLVSVTSGTLLLSGANDKIGDATRVTLNNGMLKFEDGGSGGYAETMGVLTLSTASTLDFGTGTAAGNTFNFSSFSATTIAGLNSGTLSLNIWNWSGDVYHPATTSDPGADLSQDRLLFSNLAGLTSDGLGRISFYSGPGTGPLGTGHEITFGGGLEIVPVPEPSSTALIGAIGLLGLIGFRERRRFFRAHPRG